MKFMAKVRKVNKTPTLKVGVLDGSNIVVVLVQFWA